MGVVYPFCHWSIMNCIKCNSTWTVVGVYPFAFKICLATMGVAFLSAATSVVALFLFLEAIIVYSERYSPKNRKHVWEGGATMKKIISILLVLAMCLSICACGAEKEPSELDKARDRAKAAQDALDSISKAADEAVKRKEDAEKLMDDLFGD